MCFPHSEVGRFAQVYPHSFSCEELSAQCLGLELYCGDTEEIKSGTGVGRWVQLSMEKSSEPLKQRQEMWSQCLHCSNDALGVNVL